MNPKVTVLLTIRNNVDTIKKCIDSILNQSYRNFDVFVVDAFSDEGTYEILKSYGKKIRLEQLKSNPPQAYNYAIKKISSEIIAFTNGDCVADRDWLRELIKPFENKDVASVAGIAKNPKNPESKLQEIIGIELEDRYNHFPREILRAPEMNLAVRASVMKKLMFDPKLDTSYDADFGFRLNESGLGKMIYQPSSVIYHYHRPTWKAFYKQQFKYGKFVAINYLSKHMKRIRGDNISKTSMMIQIPLLYLGALSLLLSLIFSSLFLPALIIFMVLYLLYMGNAAVLSRRFTDFFYLFAMFFVRNVAWCLGILKGLIELAK